MNIQLVLELKNSNTKSHKVQIRTERKFASWRKIHFEAVKPIKATIFSLWSFFIVAVAVFTLDTSLNPHETHN